VFEKWLLRIYGPKKKEVTVGWRKLYNEELRSFLSSNQVSSDGQDI
jgi:hypothetical protein